MFNRISSLVSKTIALFASRSARGCGLVPPSAEIWQRIRAQDEHIKQTKERIFLTRALTGSDNGFG